MNVLVLAAHPDDEVLGCGGTIARLASEGHEVYISILGEGATSRGAQRRDADMGLVATLQEDGREAGRIMGAKEVLFHSLPDNRFDTVPLLDVVKIIEEQIERIQPEVVYTQDGGDLNIDHSVTFRATLTATRPMQHTSVKTIYSYEVASSTEWAFQQFQPTFKPNVFRSIEDTLEIKIRAMEVYKSELRDFPHPRSIEGLRVVARRWGMISGLKAAEAFSLIRQVG